MLEDLRSWVPLLCAGGVLAGHDYITGQGTQVCPALAHTDAHTPMPTRSHPPASSLPLPPRAPGPGRACAARLARQRARLRRRAPGCTRLFVTSGHPASFFLFKGASFGVTLGGEATAALKFAASS